MKLKTLLIFLSLFGMVAMLTSCTCYNTQEPHVTWPTTSTVPTSRAIGTTMVEVTGDKGETLAIKLDPDTGECKESYVNGIPTNCRGPKLSETYFCTPPDKNHPANTDMNKDGELEVYCGVVKFLTNGTDIQFEADTADRNWKCKVVGGCAFCYP